MQISFWLLQTGMVLSNYILSHLWELFCEHQKCSSDYNHVVVSLPISVSSSTDHGSTIVIKADLDRCGEHILSDQRELSAQHHVMLDHILAQLEAYNIGQTTAS